MPHQAESGHKVCFSRQKFFADHIIKVYTIVRYGPAVFFNFFAALVYLINEFGIDALKAILVFELWV